MKTINRYMFLAPVLWCGLAGVALGHSGQAAAQLSPQLSTAGQAAAKLVAWYVAFDDRSGTHPVHFVAGYLDGAGKPHRLEEWRSGITHLRRRTDSAIDLHADASFPTRPNQPVDYQWQILDLPRKIDHRVSSQGMLRAGMLYSFYSMAHVLTRPTGHFEVHPVEGLAPIDLAGARCRWFQVVSSGQPDSRVCWASAFGIPLRTLTETSWGWRTNFELQQLDQRPVPTAIFAVNTQGFQIRNLEELEDED